MDHASDDQNDGHNLGLVKSLFQILVFDSLELQLTVKLGDFGFSLEVILFNLG